MAQRFKRTNRMDIVNARNNEEPGAGILDMITKTLTGKNSTTGNLPNEPQPDAQQTLNVVENNPVEVKNNTNKKNTTRYRRNTRRNQKNENSNLLTPSVPAQKNKTMSTLFNTVPDFVQRLKGKKDQLMNLYENHTMVKEIPNDLKDDLEQLKKFSMELPMITFQVYVQRQGLMDFEEIPITNEFHMDMDSPTVSISTRNSMKLGWISLLQIKPVEKLVGV